MSFNTNKLFYGDNLQILRSRIPANSIDLIYLDPPFNSKADYNILFKESTGEESAAQIQAFSDFWHWDTAAREAFEYLALSNQVNDKVASLADALHRLLGKNDMSAYLFMMTIRLIELHRVLKPKGCLFLHCDPTASHYLKLVLDAIFEPENFRNEIIWKRTSAHNDAKRCGAVHDTILFYSKSTDYVWHPERVELSQDYKEEFLDQYDEELKQWYKRADLTGPGAVKGNSESGKPWRGINPTKNGRHWAISNWARELAGVGENESVQKALDKLDKKGMIHWPKKEGGMPRLRVYEDQLGGMPPQDVWNDIRPLHNLSPERLGYPTQKPVALLKRIIEAASNPGDWILDPFCGCGTAIEAAELLHRHWIGIDITWLAINLIKGRTRKMFPDAQFQVEGEPRDLGAAQSLWNGSKYQFQWWALSLIGARPVGATPAKPTEGKKGSDRGIDGWLRFKEGEGEDAPIRKIIVQVKGGENVGVSEIRDLVGAITRENAAMGIYITLHKPTREMEKEVKALDPYVMRAWGSKYPKIQIITIEELLQGKQPDMPQTASAFQEAMLAKRITKGKNMTLDSYE